MTVASSGQGPKDCKVLSSGPLIRGRTPRTQSSPSLSSLHPCGASRMIPGLQTVKYTCFYEPDPLPISLTLSSVSAHSKPSYTHSDPLQCTSLHPNLIVTSYLTPKPLMGSLHPPPPRPPPYLVAHNKCMQKEEAWPASAFSFAQRCRSHRRAIPGRLLDPQ